MELGTGAARHLLWLTLAGCTSTPQDSGTRDSSTDSPTETGTPSTGDCLWPEDADRSGTERWIDALGQTTVTLDDAAACARTYTLTSTAALRDDQPSNPRTVVEGANNTTLRSGNDVLDALYALALTETRELSVDSIQDGSFSDGNPVPCGGCFETGRLWRYVWTRDTAYAVDLGMGLVAPTRSRRSLEFKLSERRGGGDLQVVQDTGTGGSYPVSTDRVVWALGAHSLANTLPDAERVDFVARAYQALANTLEHDRLVAFDPSDGLYRGEQSFLDWREQTYPDWTATDVVHVGMSKALSTNLLHLNALEVTSEWASETGHVAEAQRYAGWAASLRAAIHERLWLEEHGQFSTYSTTGLDPAPTVRFDLLGASLAVLLDVATPSEAQRVLSTYPHYGPGAPVVWPQQQSTPIYHNRGEWPFVTAYWLRAAQKADHPAVADRMVKALVRGAALNLSNMENFEAGSGAAYLEDGDASGPVVNSQRQLWSVAGYLSMVHHTWFGLQPEGAGLAVRPYLTGSQRSELFGGTEQLVLNDVAFKGARLTVVLRLPSSSGSGRLPVTAITLDGVAVSGDLLPALDAGHHVVEVTVGEASASTRTLTEVSDADWRQVFGPRTPTITGVSESSGAVVLGLSVPEPSDTTLTVLRDGVVVASDLPGSTTSWTDIAGSASTGDSPCYTVRAVFSGSGNHSQHAPPRCWWGADFERVFSAGADALTAVGGQGSSSHGRFHYEPWGDAGDTLTLAHFTPAKTGEHLVQVVYGNGAGAVSTGVTAGVKQLVVEDVSTGSVVGSGVVVMPHLGDWDQWADSSLVAVALTEGVDYRLRLQHADHAVNMSSFAHFETYTGGLGGSEGAFNRVNIAEMKVLTR